MSGRPPLSQPLPVNAAVSRLSVTGEDGIASSPDWAGQHLASTSAGYVQDTVLPASYSELSRDGSSEFIDGDPVATSNALESTQIDYSSHFLDGLCSSKSETRMKRMETVSTLILLSASGALDETVEEDSVNENDDCSSISPGPQRLLLTHLKALSMLSREAPFPEIREELEKLLKNVQDAYGVSPDYSKTEISSFFEMNEILPSTDSMNNNSSIDLPLSEGIVADMFLRGDLKKQNSRILPVNRVLLSHVTYLKNAIALHDLLMQGPGPLTTPWRHYISILAAARFRCGFLVSQQIRAFRAAGGDEEWLKGYRFSPPKMKKLLHMNAVICHQPWLMTPEIIEELLESENSEEIWSVGETVQALSIMSQIHCVCSLFGGCGIIDHGITEDLPEVESLSTSVSDEKEDNEDQKEDLGSVTTESTGPNDAESLQIVMHEIEATEELNINSEELKNARKKAFDSIDKGVYLKSKTRKTESKSDPILRFLDSEHATMQHSDFDVTSKDYQVLTFQEYSWNDHVYPLLRRYYQEVADLLDTQFTTCYSLTYHTLIGSKDVDTSTFRSAIWKYVQRIYGLLHEDYQYKNVNLVLNQNIKKFLKNVVTQPDQITSEDFASLGLPLLLSEKIHVVLLASEAKRQAVLLRGLNAVNLCFQNRD